LGTTEEIAKQIRFLEGLPDQTLGYEIDGKPSGDPWKRILVLFNGSGESKKVETPKGAWKTFVKGNRPGDEKTSGSGNIDLPPHSATILYMD
jgi:pullulanase